MKPSAAQIEAGNYPKEHVTAHGMRVSIENAKGSTRSGVSKTGKRWSNKMEHDYGYIRGTSGRDGDHIDVFLGPHHADPSVPVHVVDQVDPDTGDFDEHKVMLGFKTEDDAIDAYHANYESGWQGMKAVTPLSMDKFKAWAFTEGTRMKPVSEHSVSADEIRAFATGGSVTDGGAFIGYKSAGKRKPEHNDRAAAADMPFQAARGWAAGTAGLPGDIESLTRAFIRMLGSEGSPAANVSEHSTLPTSEFYKEWLPGAPTGASGKAAGEVGSLFGGVGAGSVARGTAKAGKFAAKGAAEQIAKGLEGQGALSSVLSPAAPMYAVKPKGGNSPVPGQRWLTAEELKDAMPQADIPDDMLDAGGFKAGGAVRRFNDGGGTGNSDGSSGGVDNGSQDGASGSLGGGSDSSVQDGASGITNTAGYADRQGVTGANTDSSTNVGSSSFGMGDGLSFDHMLEALANEQAINGITNTAGYAQRQGVTGANTNQSTNPNSSSGGTGPGINTGQSFSSSPLGGVLGFLGNLGLNAATGGGYGMANSLTGAATGQSLTSRALDALSAAFDNPTPGVSPDGTPEVGPGLPGGSVNDSGSLNYAINPVNNPGALSGLYTPAPLNTGTPAWADPLAVAGHALRVYDPVFTPGNPTV